MNWNSASEFFAMGGYGLYVWGSYGVTALWMLSEPFAVRSRLRSALSNIDNDSQMDSSMESQRDTQNENTP
jgi:heme exporter protein D